MARAVGPLSGDHSTSMQRRGDITGLRAVAILPVILFHLGVRGFSGGFVGVDVFFVISGFLITGLIGQEMDRGAFRYRDFYERRIRRIIPALFAMMLLTALTGLIILSPRNLERTGRSMVAAVLFVSNLLFASETNYFDPALTSRPLLHTWSLSIEEQFYLLFPLLLLKARIRSRQVLWIAIIAALSLIWSIAGASERGFYSTGMRVWELGLGALLALGALPKWTRSGLADAASVLGLVLILGSVFLLSSALPYPSYWALLPCIGAGLILHAGLDRPSLAGRWLSSGPLVFVGLISYSLYLWHWPIIVFYKYLFFRTPGPMAMVALGAATLAVSIGSYYGIEQPFRRRGTVSRRALFTVSGVGAVGLVALGAGLMITHGLPQRSPANLAPLGEGAYHEHQCFLQPKDKAEGWTAQACTFGPGPKRIVLWGDSFAAHLVPGLETVAPDLGGAVIEGAYSSCPPLIDFSSQDRPDCGRFNKVLLDAIGQIKPDIVILSANWEAYASHPAAAGDAGRLASGLTDTIEAVRAAGAKQVLVVGQSPGFLVDVPQLAMGLNTRKAALSFTPAVTLGYDSSLRAAASSQSALWFSAKPALCDATVCRLADDQGRLLFWDTGHYSVYGSRLVARAMLPVLRQGLDPGALPG